MLEYRKNANHVNPHFWEAENVCLHNIWLLWKFWNFQQDYLKGKSHHENNADLIFCSNYS